MNNLTLKAKLFGLMTVALLALLLVGAAGWVGLVNTAQSVNEIGKVRLPSVLGLEIINEGQTAIRSSNRRVAFFENDYKAQAKFADELKNKEQKWNAIDEGWKLYEPLPQTTEEAALWKQFVKAWDDWKDSDAKITEIIAALSSNSDEKRQKELFVDFYQRSENAVALFDKAEDILDKIIDLNVKVGDAAVVEGEHQVGMSKMLMLSGAAVTFVVLLLLGAWITRSILLQLGGEPDVAAGIANKIAAGDLSSQIVLQAGDNTSLMAAMSRMSDALKAVLSDTDILIGATAVGDLGTRADAGKHQGDFRTLVQGINQMLDGVILPINEVVGVLTQVEQGDLTSTVNGDYKGQLRNFKETVNNTIAQLSQTISEVIAAADQLGNASEQISATSQSLSQASSEQAAGVEETSASIEQMSASIQQNTENAKVTDGMASKAAQEASEGGVAVKQTVGAMKDIAAKIGIIDDIAYQTNMLALNAAIEAARAGDHGKGFAVVAAEVRKLAERSQIAAQEIGELAETSVKTAESAGSLLDAIVPSIAKTSELVQEIAAASLEQSAGVNQVNVAMNQMNQITQQNASASEELAATAEEMTGQAEQLQSLMSFFRINQIAGGTQSRAAAIVSGKAPSVSKSLPRGKHKHAAGEHYDLSQFERF